MTQNRGSMEQQYLDGLRYILAEGTWETNRTGIDCKTVPGYTLTHDMRDGYPAITSKKLAFGQVKGELIAFIRGLSSAADFRALGCNVWNQNANENGTWLASPYRKGLDDLGRVYGVQWRDWTGPDGKKVDQLFNAIKTVMTDPGNRRIIVNAWNPAELEQMALPPCHLMFQLIPNKSTNTLHLTMYQRSH